MTTQRKDDGPDYKNHFATERMFESDGYWYFYTREGTTEGPYSTQRDAVLGLETFITQLDMKMSPAFYELSIEH